MAMKFLVFLSLLMTFNISAPAIATAAPSTAPSVTSKGQEYHPQVVAVAPHPAPAATAAALPAKFSANMAAEVRNGFIRKVYLILTFQLVLTCAVAAPFVVFRSEVRDWLIDTDFVLMWVALGVLIACIGVFICVPMTLRKAPWNYVIMVLFTLAQSVFVGLISAHYDVLIVALAFGTTAVVVIALTVYAMTTKTDFTGYGAYLLVALIVLVVFGFVLAFVPFDSTANKIYGALGALVFSMFLVYDTQRVVGGKNRKYQLSVDDYVIGAISLYLDVINIFVSLLSIFGSR